MSEWDGRPENPERDGWHWLSVLRGVSFERPLFWHAKIARWELSNGECIAPHECAERWRYLGPCPTPAEVEAREAAAAEAMRDIAAETAREACLVPPDGGSPNADEVEVCDEAERRIRSLPLPAADALARALDAARAEEREACIEALRSIPVKIVGDATHPDMRVALRVKEGISMFITEAAAAIRARGKEAQGE